jgi:RNA polymerase-interacting CarD/CdnL/TRCF family regulator
LSSSDSKFFEQAKKLVEEEFAFVLGIKETEVEEYIRERLEK